MRENFLTIPDAPAYEINSDLIARDKKTGHLIKPIIYYGNKYYRLFGTAGRHSAITLRRQAVAAVSKSTFEPILSFDGKYEINKRGVVRNAKTKKIIKPYNGAVQLYYHRQKKSRRVTDLMWEVHGKIPTNRKKIISCAIANTYVKKKFPCLRAAAAYISSRYPRSINSVLHHLHKRRAEFYGWQITYFDKLTDF